MRQCLVPILLALGAAPAGPACATDSDGVFKRIDRNADGAISRAEFAALREAMFVRIDADEDGYATHAEIAAGQSAVARAPRPGRVWSQDTDGDGRLSLAEYAAVTRGFDIADRNGDGSVSLEEFARIVRHLAKADP